MHNMRGPWAAVLVYIMAMLCSASADAVGSVYFWKAGQEGSWSEASRWVGGSVPVSNATVIIAGNNSIVTLPEDGVFRDLWSLTVGSAVGQTSDTACLYVEGTLGVGVGGLLVGSGSKLDIGQGSVSLRGGVSEVSKGGELVCDGCVMEVAGNLKVAGSVEMKGANSQFLDAVPGSDDRGALALLETSSFTASLLAEQNVTLSIKFDTSGKMLFKGGEVILSDCLRSLRIDTKATVLFDNVAIRTRTEACGPNDITSFFSFGRMVVSGNVSVSVTLNIMPGASLDVGVGGVMTVSGGLSNGGNIHIQSHGSLIFTSESRGSILLDSSSNVFGAGSLTTFSTIHLSGSFSVNRLLLCETNLDVYGSTDVNLTSAYIGAAGHVSIRAVPASAGSSLVNFEIQRGMNLFIGEEPKCGGSQSIPSVLKIWNNTRLKVLGSVELQSASVSIMENSELDVAYGGNFNVLQGGESKVEGAPVFGIFRAGSFLVSGSVLVEGNCIIKAGLRVKSAGSLRVRRGNTLSIGPGLDQEGFVAPSIGGIDVEEGALLALNHDAQMSAINTIRGNMSVSAGRVVTWGGDTVAVEDTRSGFNLVGGTLLGGGTLLFQNCPPSQTHIFSGISQCAINVSDCTISVDGAFIQQAPMTIQSSATERFGILDVTTGTLIMAAATLTLSEKVEVQGPGLLQSPPLTGGRRNGAVGWVSILASSKILFQDIGLGITFSGAGLLVDGEGSARRGDQARQNVDLRLKRGSAWLVRGKLLLQNVNMVDGNGGVDWWGIWGKDVVGEVGGLAWEGVVVNEGVLMLEALERTEWKNVGVINRGNWTIAGFVKSQNGTFFVQKGSHRAVTHMSVGVTIECGKLATNVPCFNLDQGLLSGSASFQSESTHTALRNNGVLFPRGLSPGGHSRGNITTVRGGYNQTVNGVLSSQQGRGLVPGGLLILNGELNVVQGGAQIEFSSLSGFPAGTTFPLIEYGKDQPIPELAGTNLRLSTSGARYSSDRLSLSCQGVSGCSRIAVAVTGCPKGSAAAENSPCTLCLPGSFAIDTYASSCELCPAGQYQPDAGKSSCILCQSGHFSPTNATSCSRCPVGHFSKANGSAECSPCPAGKQQPSEGSSGCLDCSPGSYSNQQAAATCTLCQAGTSQAHFGNISCDLCPPGSYADSSGSSSCTVCREGSYASGKGTFKCFPCSPNTFAKAKGSTKCEACPNGTSTGDPPLYEQTECVHSPEPLSASEPFEFKTIEIIPDSLPTPEPSNITVDSPTGSSNVSSIAASVFQRDSAVSNGLILGLCVAAGVIVLGLCTLWCRQRLKKGKQATKTLLADGGAFAKQEVETKKDGLVECIVAFEDDDEPSPDVVQHANMKTPRPPWENPAAIFSSAAPGTLFISPNPVMPTPREPVAIFPSSVPERADLGDLEDETPHSSNPPSRIPEEDLSVPPLLETSLPLSKKDPRSMIQASVGFFGDELVNVPHDTGHTSGGMVSALRARLSAGRQQFTSLKEEVAKRKKKPVVDETEYLKFKYIMRGAKPRYPRGMVKRDTQYEAAEPSEF